MENEVVTFDKVKYSLPELDSDCEVILTKDCSTKHGVFTILAKPTEIKDKKLIKLLIPKHKVEIIPERYTKIKVDGKEQNVYEGSPIQIKGNKLVSLK